MPISGVHHLPRLRVRHGAEVRQWRFSPSLRHMVITLPDARNGVSNSILSSRERIQYPTLATYSDYGT